MAAFELPSRSLSRTSISSSHTGSSESFDLPFPEPLPRSSFLTPDFNPQTYLSSLGPRHQTLEDLRSDLHARSQQLSQELLDLVNNHYSDFLELGSSVKGQGEKVEELRVGVMGVRREVEGVRKTVVEKERVVRGLVGERKKVRAEMEKAGSLLRWEEEIGRLEGKIEQAQAEEGEGSDEDWSSEAEEEDDESTAEIARMKRRARDLVALEKTADSLGKEHPFVVNQMGRLVKLRGTVVRDVRAALQGARTRKEGDAVVDYLGLMRELGAQREAVDVLSTAKKR